MARRPRLAAQAARASLQTPIPRLSDNEDEDMNDAPTTNAPTPQDDEEDNEEAEEDVEEDEEQIEPEDVPTPTRSGRGSRTPRRRGRPGRPATGRRRGRQSRVESLRNDASDDGGGSTSDAPTPRRRGGFRGHRGGRWANKRGGLGRQSQAPVDDDGNTLNILNDEVELPDNEEGETKINKDGELQGGREYRVRTFTLLHRGKRLYMLSTEPARCIGFRDSYLFFQKHKHLFKIIIDDDEKKDLIERDLIPHSYKGRAIGVVTARSVFREFGSKIVIGGRKITDDYDADAARERGDEEGELAVPDDRIPGPGETYNRNQYVAWHGASAVYHTNLPTVPLQNGKAIEGKRRKVTVTSDNWMLEHARDSSRFNSGLAAARRENSEGVYDIHTNTIQWPADMQPTHARWEMVEDESEGLDESSVGFITQKLSKLQTFHARNFRIHDLCLEGAPESSFAAPGYNINFSGLSTIHPDIINELPADCKQHFNDAVKREHEWQGKWLDETVNGHRAHFMPSVEWFPK